MTPVSRTTPTGAVLTLEDAAPQPSNYDVAAGLVADRMFDLVASPGDNASGDLTYDKIKRAVALMLAEGSVRVSLQYA